jgi:hypothetical protein
MKEIVYNAVRRSGYYTIGKQSVVGVGAQWGIKNGES